MPNEVISQYQNALVKDRQILDCCMVANEALDSRHKQGKGGGIFKVYMMKAYDHDSWNFLDFVLGKMGFGRRWRIWVHLCISHARVSVMVNGNT